MQLGLFTKNLKTGELTGSIRTLSAVVEAVVVAPATERRSESSPNYRVYGPTGSDFGAGWNKLSRDGRAYISLVLRDPSFNGGQPLYPILVEGQDGRYAMVWEAPDATKAPVRPEITPAEIAAAEAEAPAPGRKGKR